MWYVGTVVAGHELVSIWVSGRQARYICTDQVGGVHVFEERIKGDLPMRLAALRYLLDAAPPGTVFAPAHPGSITFFRDWEESTLACSLLHEEPNETHE
jgi:hypothetical protein